MIQLKNESLVFYCPKKHKNFWRRTKDGTASAWDNAKRIANASWKNPRRIREAKREHDMQDALHNQDMVAGGYDVIGSLLADGSRTLGDGDFGLSDTNQHIGSQWNGPRIRTIDIEACQMGKAGLGNENLNIELRPCGKHESAECKQKRKRKRK